MRKVKCVGVTPSLLGLEQYGYIAFGGVQTALSAVGLAEGLNALKALPRNIGSLPSTRADLHMDLRSKGYEYRSTSAGGYVSYKHSNGTEVYIKPSGEVIPVRKHIRLDYQGTPLPGNAHSTGHFVTPLGEL